MYLYRQIPWVILSMVIMLLLGILEASIKLIFNKYHLWYEWMKILED